MKFYRTIEYANVSIVTKIPTYMTSSLLSFHNSGIVSLTAWISSYSSTSTIPSIVPVTTSPSSYSGTVTEFFTTSFTASSNELSYTILFSPQVTSFSDISGSTYTNPQETTVPWLTLTDVVGIAYSKDGQPLKTATLMQPAPTQATGTDVPTQSAVSVVMVDGGVAVQPACNSFTCWSGGAQAGVLTATFILIAFILLVLWWFFHLRPRGIGLFKRRGSPTGEEEFTSTDDEESMRGRPRRYSDDSDTLSVADIENTSVSELVPVGVADVPAAHLVERKKSTKSAESGGEVERRYKKTYNPPPPPGVRVMDWEYVSLRNVRRKKTGHCCDGRKRKTGECPFICGGCICGGILDENGVVTWEGSIGASDGKYIWSEWIKGRNGHGNWRMLIWTREKRD